MLAVADAGCKKRRAANVLPNEWSLNASPPMTNAVTLESLPKAFTWLDVDGVNMVAPSWNQHIVSRLFSTIPVYYRTRADTLRKSFSANAPECA